MKRRSTVNVLPYESKVEYNKRRFGFLNRLKMPEQSGDKIFLQ